VATPVYIVSQMWGTAPQLARQESANGEITWDNPYASMSLLSFDIQNFTPNQLGIKYSCFYNYHIQNLIKPGDGADGTLMPNVSDPSQSAYICAVALQLTGGLSDQYYVAYDAKAFITNKYTGTPENASTREYTGVDGSFAGECYALPDDLAWIYHLYVRVSPREP